MRIMKSINKQELHLIFQEIKQGNSNKLDDLYGKYNKLIYNIAFSILKNRENSEDIVQIVFIKLFQMEKNKLPTTNESTWIYSLTKNETLNYLRKKKQEVNLDEIYYITEEDKELNKIIDNDNYNRIIAKLNKQEREIISLKLLSNMSFKEISLLLDIPMGTVQWKYYTSLYTLRLLLGNISMVIIGILIYIKSNMSNRKMEQQNESNKIEIDNENINAEEEPSKNETSSSIESNTNSTDDIFQNEIIEVQEPPNNNYESINFNIGILSFTGIFLLFSIIFAIIFIKHQQKAEQNVSK